MTSPSANPRRVAANTSRKRPASNTSTLLPISNEQSELQTGISSIASPITAVSSASIRKATIEQIKAKIASGLYTTHMYGRHGAEKILNEHGEDTVGRRCSRCHNIFMHDNQHFRDHVNLCPLSSETLSSTKKSLSGASVRKKLRKQFPTKRIAESVTNLNTQTLSVREDALKHVAEEINVPIDEVRRTWQCLNQFLQLSADLSSSDEQEDITGLSNVIYPEHHTSNDCNSEFRNGFQSASNSSASAIKVELTEGDSGYGEFQHTTSDLHRTSPAAETVVSNGLAQQSNESNSMSSATFTRQVRNTENGVDGELYFNSCLDLERRLLEAKIKHVEVETALMRQKQMQEMELIRERMKYELEKHELEMKRLR